MFLECRGAFCLSIHTFFHTSVRIFVISCAQDARPCQRSPGSWARPLRPIGQASIPLGQDSKALNQASRLLGQASRHLGLASRPLGQAFSSLGQAFGPQGQVSKPLGQITIPLGQASMPVNLAFNPLDQAPWPPGLQTRNLLSWQKDYVQPEKKAYILVKNC